MTDDSQPLLPPGTGPKLARAALDLLAALIWFWMSIWSGANETDLFLDNTASDVCFVVAFAAALITGVAFGLRMASIALDRIPDWVSRVELWTWIALPIWFGIAVVAVRI